MECCREHSCRKRGGWQWHWRRRKGAIPVKEEHGIKKIVLIGTPNVGKSMLFHRLTGTYVTISNYPGTTVEIFRGRGAFEDQICEVIDTPGMYSLLPVTEEERVTRALLFAEHPEVILHVIDAKNLEKMLHLTLQLLEAELPVILVINMVDEAEELGIKIDFARLQEDLGIPVVATAASKGWGIELLRKKIVEYIAKHGLRERVV